MPFLYKVAASDLFLENSGDEANRNSSENIMTTAAFSQCNAYIANNVLADHTVVFNERAINAFSLGSFQYVINADVEIQPTNAASFNRRYVCRIKFLNGDDTTELSNPDNWSTNGISGLDNI